MLGIYFIKPALNNYIIPLIGQQNPNMIGFAKLLLSALVILIFGAFASWCNSRLMLFISTNLLFNIRCDLFNKLEKLPIKFYDSHTHGELMSRFTNDTDALREMMSQTIPQLFSSILTVVAVFIMMIVLSPMLTIIMVVTMFFATLLVTKIGNYEIGRASCRERV